MQLGLEKGDTASLRVLLKCVVAQAVKDKSGTNGPICMKQGAKAAQSSGE
jgi:hypothetical protein